MKQIFIAYYAYACLVVYGTYQVIFIMGHSSWWIAGTIVLLSMAPSYKERGEE